MPTAVKPTPAEVFAERGAPPIGSVWKFYTSSYITEYKRARFYDPLPDEAEAFVEVHSSPELIYGYLLDVYLRFNSRQGGFQEPYAASREIGQKLAHLLPWEFWEWVDRGLLKRIDAPEGR